MERKRIIEGELREKRRTCNVTFLVTGGTGFLGSHIAMELISRGYRVKLLCRPMKDTPAKDRVKQMISWFRMEGRMELARLDVVEGFLDRENFGLANKEYDRLCSSVDEIVHCAASTSFSEAKREDLESANIKSIENLFKFSSDSRSRCYYFHHVSTVYVAGKCEGRCDEELRDVRPSNEFHNGYEETKARGEAYVWRVFPSEGIRVNIYRPSIIYGHSETGKTFRFNALYYPLKMILFFRDTYRDDILRRGGMRSEGMGVKLEPDGSLILPIRMETRENGTIDLIPIDFFIEAFMSIMDECTNGDIFHIVSGTPLRLEEIIDYVERMFGVKGITAVQKEDFERKPSNALEMLFNGYLRMYEPYIRDLRQFDYRKTFEILRKKNIVCPPFDYYMFMKCMNYAIAVDWGKFWKW